MTDYSAATINTGNALAGRLVRAVGGGRLQDIVGGATLTTNGTVTSTTDGFTFGSGASIVLPDTLLTQFTVFVWAFATNTTSALVSRSTGSANGYNQNYALRLQSGITPRGEFKQDFTANYPTLSSSSSGTNGTLLTTAFSYDGTNQEIYLNGTSTGTQAAPAPFTSSSTGMVTQIGAVDGTERALNYSGNGIQLVLIFNAALTDAEITSLHANPDQVFNLGGGDTTAPILTSAVGTATGSTTATVGATTDEANGTLRVVVTTSATQPSIAQIKAGQDHTGATAPYAGSQTITTTGAKTFSATGLTASTTYYAHNLHTDAAANDSNRLSSASFTTTTPDVTAPTLSSGVGTVKSNALIVVGATTNEANGTMYVVVTTSATAPSAAQVKAGQNNGGTAAVFAANQAIGSTGAKTFNATGLTQLTGYYPYIVHTDAAGNDSSVLSIGLRTTFRDGATGQSVVDNTGPVGGNPEGFLYNKVTLPADADKWFSYVITTPPATGSFSTLNPNGTFVFTGPNTETMYVQLEVDGANFGSPFLVTLYDVSGATTLKYWTGSAWASKPLKVWNGSAWVVKPLKRWTGSGWV